MERITNDNIETLQENEIFVFGSNESGRHGKGGWNEAEDEYIKKCIEYAKEINLIK
jgi:hypothetical protein